MSTTRYMENLQSVARSAERRGLRSSLAMLACALLVACGGDSSPPPLPAPTGLAYPETGTWVVGQAITPLTPTVSGTVSSFSVTPALPAGLALDTTSGALTGTPTTPTANATYVITAANSSGSASYSLEFQIGTVDILSGASATRSVVAGTSISIDTVIKPRYLGFSGTLYSRASDANGVFSAPVTVTSNTDGSFTLEAATSSAAGAGSYSGTATLQLCKDPSCSTPQPVPSVTMTYDVQILGPNAAWPGNHLSALTPWNGAPDWQTFQGNSAHSGYVPVTVSPDQIITRWQRGITANLYYNSIVNLATVTTSNGLFYIAGGNMLEARRESDASLVWRYDFSGLQFPSANPPAVSNGVVYIAAGQQSSTSLFAFDAASGALVFTSPMSSQWENYLAPTTGSGGVYTNAGTYGGIYAFNTTGQQLFFANLSQQSAWTPAVDSTTVYAYTGDALTLIDPNSGQVTGRIVDPTFSNYIYVIGGSVVLGTLHSAFAAAYANSILNGGAIGNSLLHFNTSTLTIDWKIKGVYPSTPAYKSGVIFAVNNNPLQLEARSETDGTLLWAWVAPASGDTEFKSEVLLTNNLAFVSTNLSVYAIDLTTHRAVWSYPASGNLALSSNGVLYLEGANTLTAFNAK